MANTTITNRTVYFECSGVRIKDSTIQTNQHLAQASLTGLGEQVAFTFFLGTKCLTIRTSLKEADRFLESCKEEGLTLIME